jgi:sarcosine oxidase subunit gamma
MSEAPLEQKDAAQVAVRWESPLHFMMGTAERHSRSDCGVVIREEMFKGHLSLRGDPASELFRSGVAEVLGVELPVTPGTCIANGGTSVFWLGPTEWLVLVDDGTQAEVEDRLRQTLTGHFAVVDISGGQTLLRLSGNAVAMVLKKSSVYDFHPSRFTEGRCVQTTFAKASALVCKTADDSFNLVIRRSFSDYLFRWIVDAASEYGIDVESGSKSHSGHDK